MARKDEWLWLEELTYRGIGAPCFGVSEMGQIGLWIGEGPEGEPALGYGDTPQEAVRDAMGKWPNPETVPRFGSRRLHADH